MRLTFLLLFLLQMPFGFAMGEEQSSSSAEAKGFFAQLAGKCFRKDASDSTEAPSWYISCSASHGDSEDENTVSDLEQGVKNINDNVEDDYKTFCCLYIRDTRGHNDENEDASCCARAGSCCSPKNIFLRFIDAKDYILKKISSPAGTIWVAEISIAGGVISTLMWATPYEWWFGCSTETSIGLQTAGGYLSAAVLLGLGGIVPAIKYGWEKRHQAKTKKH